MAIVLCFCCKRRNHSKAEEDVEANLIGRQEHEEERADNEGLLVGSKHRTLSPLFLCLDKELTTAYRQLPPGEIVQIISVDEEPNESNDEVGRPIVALVHCRCQGAGYVDLDAVDFSARLLPGSRSIGGRYTLKLPTLLQAGPDAFSERVGEAFAKHEVLTVDFGLSNMEDLTDPNNVLRVLVKVSDGSVGWMNVETTAGDPVLDQVNLLGPDIVNMYAAGVYQKTSSMKAIRLKSGKKVVTSEELPWQLDGKYRVLERLPLLAAIELEGEGGYYGPGKQVIGTLTAGSSVEVQDRLVLEESKPYLYVKCTCDDEHDAGRELEGWILAAGPVDERNFVDVRDQHEIFDVEEDVAKMEARGMIKTVSLTGRASKMEAYDDEEETEEEEKESDDVVDVDNVVLERLDVERSATQ